MAKEDSGGRMSWDETAVLIAATGYEPYYTLQKGKIMVAADGSNQWQNGDAAQAYIQEKVPFEQVQALINKLMMHQPVKSATQKGESE